MKRNGSFTSGPLVTKAFITEFWWLSPKVPRPLARLMENKCFSRSAFSELESERLGVMLVRPAFCGPGTKGPHDGHYWPLNEGLFGCWKLFRLLLLIFVKNNPFCNYFAGNRWPRQMPNARNNGFFAPVRFGPEAGWEFPATNRPEHPGLSGHRLPGCCPRERQPAGQIRRIDTTLPVSSSRGWAGRATRQLADARAARSAEFCHGTISTTGSC